MHSEMEQLHDGIPWPSLSRNYTKHNSNIQYLVLASRILYSRCQKKGKRAISSPLDAPGWLHLCYVEARISTVAPILVHTYDRAVSMASTHITTKQALFPPTVSAQPKCSVYTVLCTETEKWYFLTITRSYCVLCT